ncbi:unnamed protein product [Phaeothamnion confervicola]
MEAIKVITGSKSTLSGSLLVCNLEDPTFYKANLRGRRADCAVCGSAGASTSMELAVAAFCDAHGLDVCRRPPPPPTPPPPAVTCAEYAAVRRSGTRHVLLDVRVPVQFAVCRLPGAVSLPLAALPARLEERQWQRWERRRRGRPGVLPVPSRRGFGVRCGAACGCGL